MKPVTRTLPHGVDAFAFKVGRRKTVVVSESLSPSRVREVAARLARVRGAFDVVMTRS